MSRLSWEKDGNRKSITMIERNVKTDFYNKFYKFE
jgi:hypothetical protein